MKYAHLLTPFWVKILWNLDTFYIDDSVILKINHKPDPN